MFTTGSIFNFSLSLGYGTPATETGVFLLTVFSVQKILDHREAVVVCEMVFPIILQPPESAAERSSGSHTGCRLGAAALFLAQPVEI